MTDSQTDTPFDDDIHAVDALMTSRDKGGTTVLILGANWCPDARAFMAAINSVEGEALRKKADFVIAGIGRHDRNQDLVSMLGHDKLEGVPAVFVFNADSELVNTGEVFRWRTARDEDPADIRAGLAAYLKD